MKAIKKNKIGGALRICLLGVIGLLMASCNETMLDTLEQNYPSSATAAESSHVLMVVLDGASGRAVQTARNLYKTPVLKSMFSHALYTDYGLADSSVKILQGEMNNARGWANLFTGNTSHGVKSDGQLVNLNGQHIFSWLMDSQTNISIYASDKKFYENFVIDGIDAPKLETDLEVKNLLIEKLKNPLALSSDLIVAEFNSVQLAGENSGFYGEDGVATESVINAINILDGYIGELLEALKERPDYNKENWLVVVTSNYGGVMTTVESDDYYDDITRNTFTLIYNERLVSQVQGRPSDSSIEYEYYTPLWSYDYRYENPTGYAESAGLQGDTSLGNIEWDMLTDESKGGATLMFLIQADKQNENKGNAESYTILSKSSEIATNGWIYYFSNNGKIRFGVGTKKNLFTSSSINDQAWHSYTTVFTLDKSKTKMEVNFYLDGELDGSKTISQKDFDKYFNDDMKSTSLRIGSAYNRTSQEKINKNKVYKNCFNISNIQIYDKALSAEEVKKYAGMNQLHKMESTYALWDNLVGYWPCDLESDMLEPILPDYSKYRKSDGTTDFKIDRGSVSAWLSGKAQDPALHPILASDKLYYNRTFNTVDISRQVFLWLGKNISWNWNMEGKAWQLSYTEMQPEQN